MYTPHKPWSPCRTVLITAAECNLLYETDYIRFEVQFFAGYRTTRAGITRGSTRSGLLESER